MTACQKNKQMLNGNLNPESTEEPKEAIAIEGPERKAPVLDIMADSTSEQEVAATEELQEGPAPTVAEGIYGKVVWRDGNWMPSINIDGSPAMPPKPKGVQRELLIYQATRMAQATMSAEGPFFSNIQTRLITTVRARPDGTFAVSLPPGIYSVFSKEERGLYANQFDGESFIRPVAVTKGSATQVTIVLDYNASY